MKYPRIRDEISMDTQVNIRGYLKNWANGAELSVPSIESNQLAYFTYSEEKKYKVCTIKCKTYLSLRKIYLPLRRESYVREFYLMYNLKKCML